MTSNQSGSNCRKTCWYAAALAGVVLALLLLLAGDWRFVPAVIAGIVGAIILGAILTWTLCKDQAQEIEQTRSVGSTGTSGDAGAAAGSAAAATGTAAAAAGVAASGAAAAGAASAEANDAADGPSEPVAEPATASSIIADANDGASASVVKPSTALAGEAELAERKGAWRYEPPESDGGAGTATATKASSTAASSASTSEPATQSSAGQPAQDASLAADQDAATGDAAGAAAASGEDYDGDGIVEGANEGSRPAALDGPRDGKADDLKQIKGVGPKMEKLLNSLGFYHFDQVAGWTSDEVAWVDANLEGFKGRVSRDNWVEQAQVLAAGGETEFSKRVEKGGVY